MAVQRRPGNGRTPRTILLVDDDPDTLYSIGEALVQLGGARVLTASSGPKALAALEEGHPDVLVTDYRMPEMDGLELSRRVRRAHPGLAIVMLTAFRGDDLQDEARASGVCEVVAKPPELEDLLDSIAECCEAKRGAA